MQYQKKNKFTTIFTGFEVPVVYISEFERSRVNLFIQVIVIQRIKSGP